MLTPTLDQLGVLMQNRNAFNLSEVTASIIGAGTAGAQLTLTMPTSATVPAAIIPVTGLTTNGGVVGNGYEVYGGQSISHINLTPGQTIEFPEGCRQSGSGSRRQARRRKRERSSATVQARPRPSEKGSSMSRIFDALTIAQDEAMERLASSFSLSAPALGDSGSWRETASDGVDFFRGAKHRNPKLPGQVAVPFHKIRGYLLLAFLAIGLVVAGTSYASRTGGIGSARGKTPYGVAFESTIRPASEVRITSDAIGTVAEILVKVGDKVDKGQPLLRLSDAEAQLALQQAAGEREAAQANLDKFRARLADVNARVAVSQGQQQQVPTRQWRDSPERAQAAYDEALTNYNRAHELFEAGIVAKQELDNRTTELRLAKDDLDNAKKLASASTKLQQDQLEQAGLQAKVERQEMQEQLRQAELKYQQAKRRVEGTLVRATASGVLAEVPWFASATGFLRAPSWPVWRAAGSHDRGSSRGRRDDRRTQNRTIRAGEPALQPAPPGGRQNPRHQPAPRSQHDSHRRSAIRQSHPPAVGWPARGSEVRQAVNRAQPISVLLTTEGTYPFYTGGVSTWCHRLIWHGLPDTLTLACWRW